MNKQFSLPLISVVAVILFFTGACLPAAAETRLSEEDINEFKVYEYTSTDFQRAKRIVKELRKRKMYPEYEIDHHRGRCQALFTVGRR